jgi:hypothetical protein
MVAYCIPGDIQRKGSYKTREPIFALDDAHARVAQYADQLGFILAHPDDLLKFEEYANCQHFPIRVGYLSAYAMRLFRDDFIDTVLDLIKSIGC